MHGKATSNNKSLSDYDPTKPATSGLFGDMNCLYPTIMAELSPVGEYYELLPEEVKNLIPEDTPIDGRYC